MATVFSHIVQQRLPQESENVATAALAFVLESHETARNGMMKLLGGLVGDLPSRLWFRIQYTDGSSRPDMSGNDDQGSPRAFIENKFWAGLTDNQPVSYLRILAIQNHPTVLLAVGPEARRRTLWTEFRNRLRVAGIALTERKSPDGVLDCGATSLGPMLALTSWERLLSFLERETTDDAAAKSDLLQLRALCEQANYGALTPFHSEEISDQRTPSLVLKLSAVMKEAWEKAYAEGIFHLLTRLTPQADSRRIGIYANVLPDGSCGLFFGLHFVLWKKYGVTPLWGLFTKTNWGRSHEVKVLLEPWAQERGVFVASEADDSFVIGFDVAHGEEKDAVVAAIVERLREMTMALSALKPKSSVAAEIKNDGGENLGD